ncbi:MAG: RNA polymerase sigma-70 factor, partial [Rhodothermales bacterium]
EAELPLADRDGFADVFRRFYPPLVRYACRITGDAAAAGDVLQDVFLKLWEDRDKLTVEVSVRALLYTMVRNRALNQHRRKRWIANGVAVTDLQVEDPAPGSEETLSADELQRHLYGWIGELPPRRAEAFTLSRYHGLRHSEIAAIMDVSERTVDTHILLALRELRQRLDALQNEDLSP